MDRDAIAMSITQSWTLWQLFLPSLMAVSREEIPERKFRKAEALATTYSLVLILGLSAVRKSHVPLIGWAIGVPVMGLLYEWSYNTPDLTF